MGTWLTRGGGKPGKEPKRKGGALCSSVEARVPGGRRGGEGALSLLPLTGWHGMAWHGMRACAWDEGRDIHGWGPRISIPYYVCMYAGARLWIPGFRTASCWLLLLLCRRCFLTVVCSLLYRVLGLPRDSGQ